MPSLVCVICVFERFLIRSTVFQVYLTLSKLAKGNMSLNSKIDRLTGIVLNLQNPHQDETQSLGEQIKLESDRRAQQFATLEARLSLLESKFETLASSSSNKVKIVDNGSPTKVTKDAPKLIMARDSKAPGIETPKLGAPKGLNRSGLTSMLQQPIPKAQVPSAKGKSKRVFTELGMSYSQAAMLLITHKVIRPISPLQEPAEKPAWCDSSEFCLYHECKGHSTEDCYRLKHKIQDLLDTGSLPDPTTWSY